MVRGYILSLGNLKDQDQDKENIRADDGPSHNGQDLVPFHCR